MSISEQLREAVRGYGSVYSVAKASGISQPVLHRFVSEQRDLRLETADHLAAFFGMKLTKPTTKAAARRRKA